MQCQTMRPQSKKLLQPDTGGLLPVCTVQNTWNKRFRNTLVQPELKKMANIIRNENSVNIVAENADGDVVGSVGGMRDENNNWELIALYVDENVIGDTKFALSLVQEFAKRIKDAGATTFTTGTLTHSRVCRLYELLGGNKIKEYINERRDNVSETVFEFDINRFA